MRMIWGNWITWEALSAIGTVGALWFAVVQSSRSARLERAQAIGTLTALVGLIEPILQSPLFAIRDEDEYLHGVDFDLIEVDRRMVEKAIAGLPLISIEQASKAGVTEWLMALPLALEDVLETIPSSVARNVKASQLHASDGIRYLDEACGEFRERRELIRYGRVGRFLRRMSRRRKIQLLDQRPMGKDVE